MKVYLVGGAVRDRLLGIDSKDRDWVVVGATPDAMKARGFRPVGKDFPVFLHPDTQEEYALARTERKSGHGYGGFTFYSAPDVTLEDDLIRRDLTINAMAQDSEGNIIDPYGGQTDIHNRKLRHVSASFEEDPLRVLRVARFAARFYDKGFTIAAETRRLMKKVVDSGEPGYLVPERIWQETVNALKEKTPDVYFNTLFSCGALPVVLPLLTDFLTDDSPALPALSQAAKAEENTRIRFATLFPPSATISYKQLSAFFKKRCFPNAFAEVALLVNKYLSALIAAHQGMEAEALVDLFEKTDAFRKPERFMSALASSYYLGISSTGMLSDKRPVIFKQLDACRKVSAYPFIDAGYTGKDVGKKVMQQRVNIVSQLLIVKE
ncbi:polynucleotide adenylyltransferase [Candidatus Sororendozoicomonas aggregata]|uniref:polynucleotide adenylyltransferase n=1 Tax=Candidatus Sororendozoicomonas aggregata TaxID=3073239 RepID=UPI002ED030EB